MQATNPVVAIVDDDESIRRALRRLIRSLPFSPAAFPSGETFLDSLDQAVPSCAVVDLHMPGLSGLDVLTTLRSRSLDIPTIIITGNTQPEMRELCLAAGAVAYLEKPLDPDLVLSAIEDATA